MILNLLNDDDDRNWMDAIMTRIMEQHEPSSTPTASEIIDNLPMYSVRPKSAKRLEPAPHEAMVCAGEDCAVCHDEFSEGTKVAELPCSHVSDPIFWFFQSRS